MKGMGKVYFLQREDGLIKVGFSSDFEQRFARLQQSHPGLKILKLINGDVGRETMIHHQLRYHSEYGEWFRPTQEVLDFISSVENGAACEMQRTPVRKAWVKFEQEHAAECGQKASDFYRLCFGVRGENSAEVYAYIEREYGIPTLPFNRLHNGRTRLPSSALVHRVREAHIAEMTKIRDALLEELRIEEARGPAADELDFLDEIARLQSAFNDVRSTLTEH